MSNDIVIRNGEEEKFRKDQKKYADALKRLLKTEKELEKERARLDSRFEKLVSVCQPVLDEIFSLQVEIVKLLEASVDEEKSIGLQRDYYYKISELAANVLRSPHSLSHEECVSLSASIENAQAKIDEISKTLKEEEKKKLNLSSEDQLAIVMEILEEAEMACAMHGIHVDFSDADLTMHPQDFEDWIRVKVKAAFQEKESDEKGESRQYKEFFQKPEKEKMTATPELSALYKKLVKLIHPDRERDEKVRALKEEAMKKLTVAYEKRDLMELLRLESEWAKTSESVDFTADPKEIKNHIGLLLKKIKSLKIAKSSLIHDSKYFKLRYIGVTYYGVYDATPKEILKSLEDQKATVNELLRMLSNPKSRKRALKMM